MNVNCPYGITKQKGSRMWIECTKTNHLCTFQRYCLKERTVVNSQDAINCKLRNDE